MTGLYDKRGSQTRALLNIAPGPAATTGEAFDAAWNEMQTNHLGISAFAEMHDAYKNYIDDVFELTGKRVFNPLSLAGPGRRNSLENVDSRFQRRIDEIAKDFPEIPRKSLKEIRDEVAGVRRAARERRAEVSRRNVDFSGQLAAMSADMAATVSDPLILLSMGVGAPVAAGIVRTALIEGAIAAGVEVPIQAAVQATRPSFGEQVSVGEAALNVGTAAAGGAVFAGALKGGIRGLTKISQQPSVYNQLPRHVRDASDFLARKTEMEDQTPFVRTNDGDALHVQRYSEAQTAVKRGDPVALADDIDMPTRAEALPRAMPVSSKEFSEDEMFAELGDELVASVRSAVVESAQTIEGQKAVRRLRAIVGEDANSAAAIKERLNLRAPKEPQSLINFIKSKGGLRPDGELDFIGLTSKTRPGVISKNGLSLDEAAELAQEAGYIGRLKGSGFEGEDVGSGVPSIGEIVDALRNDFEGRRVYSAVDQDIVDERSRILSERAEVEDALNILNINKRDNALIDLALRQGDDFSAEPDIGTARVISEAKTEIERLRAENETETDNVSLNLMKDEFAERMDQKLLLPDEMGEMRLMTAREVFDELDQDEIALREFLDCAGRT
jgi:hypothetical protein